jgi:DNA-directed RNA polymerase specialized sigma24 family protein
MVNDTISNKLSFSESSPMTLTFSGTAHDSPGEDETIEEWIQQSRSGDPEAFNQLVHYFYGTIYRLAYRTLADKGMAQDATQEIFIKVWKNLFRFMRNARFSPWLHSVAIHHCLDIVRQRYREGRRSHHFKEEVRIHPDSERFDWADRRARVFP